MSSPDSSEAPICEALFRHLGKSRGSLHVPGHQQGSTLPGILDVWLGQAAKLDLTELPGLDNLAQPQECIFNSEQLTAGYYGSELCLYSVNGSSAGVMAALMAVATEQTTVLFVNAFHISAWYGLVHSGANAVRVPPRYALDGREIPADAESVEQMLQQYPEIKVVYVTTPTYQGDCSPVVDIARVAHNRGLPLIVDEAHGAHFGLIPEFPEHSVKAGADIVVQSVHKMLPGLTQTAWIHQQGPRVDGDSLTRALRSLQTSSPSYLLLASLDAAQFWLRTEGPQAAHITLQRLEDFGLLDSSQPGFVSTRHRDVLKHWVPAKSGATAFDLQQRLLARGLFPEYADDRGVLSITGLNVREQVLKDYTEVLQQWAQWQGSQSGQTSRRTTAPSEEKSAVEGSPTLDHWQALATVADAEIFQIRPRTAVGLARERICLKDAVGRIVAAPLSPYPPGTPVLYPGQLLTPAVIDALLGSVARGMTVQGIHGNDSIDVICD